MHLVRSSVVTGNSCTLFGSQSFVGWRTQTKKEKNPSVAACLMTGAILYHSHLPFLIVNNKRFITITTNTSLIPDLRISSHSALISLVTHLFNLCWKRKKKKRDKIQRPSSSLLCNSQFPHSTLPFPLLPKSFGAVDTRFYLLSKCQWAIQRTKTKLRRHRNKHL
jgi:hypothetical protein